MKTVVQPICDMLIDQDRYIGSDPVGHYCGNPTSHVLCGSHFICDSCVELLQSNPSRVTIPAHGSVIGWNDRVKTVLNSMLNASVTGAAKPRTVDAVLGSESKGGER